MNKILSGWEIKNYQHAERHAAELTRATCRLHLPCDLGGYTSPQFRVIEAFRVGEPVSFSFNGDCYPSGHIKSISESQRVITLEDGSKFYRRRHSDVWLKGGCWALVRGHHKAYNPHF